MSSGRPDRDRSRKVRVLGALVAGHGLFVLLKLLGLAAIVTLLGALQRRFGTEAAAIALLHVGAVAVLMLAFRRRHRPRHGGRA